MRRIIAEQDFRAYLSSAAGAFTQVSEEAHARLAGVSDNLKAYGRSRVESVTSLAKDRVTSVADSVKDTALAVDEKYQLTQRAQAGADVALKKGKEYNEQYGITAKIAEYNDKYKVGETLLKAAASGKELDEKYTHGKVFEAYQYGKGLADTLLASAVGAVALNAPASEGESDDKPKAE